MEGSSETISGQSKSNREFITLKLEGVVRERESGAQVKLLSHLAAPWRSISMRPESIHCRYFKAVNASLMDAWVLIVEDIFPATMVGTCYDSFCSKARSSIESSPPMFR